MQGWKKGSITVFLALMLGLLVSLLAASIESVRMAAARAQILCGMDAGLFSLFGQYDRELFDRYDLLALAGSADGSDPGLAALYHCFMDYMEPVLSENSQMLSASFGGFSGYELMTDDGGSPFLSQVRDWAEKTSGEEPSLPDSEACSKAGRWLRKGRRRRNKNWYASYQAVLVEALAAGEAAAEGELTSGEAGFLYAGNGGDPLGVVYRYAQLDLRAQVFSKGMHLSKERITAPLADRSLRTGMPMPAPRRRTASRRELTAYLSAHLGDYRSPALSGLSCQLEYVLCQKGADLPNMEETIRTLYLLRLGANEESMKKDAYAGRAVSAVAENISRGYLVPPDQDRLSEAIMDAWIYVESILDVRQLLLGGCIPEEKGGRWQAVPSALGDALKKEQDIRGSGRDYRWYLQLLLLRMPVKKLAEGGMSIIEHAVRSSGRSGFCLDACVTAAELSADVTANRRKTFEVTRSRRYDP
ncbi:MAG: hypothetical protein IJX90_10865 [Blautia sp.]|nr:hypothetical protein [Blautia sp.]